MSDQPDDHATPPAPGDDAPPAPGTVDTGPDDDGASAAPVPTDDDEAGSPGTATEVHRGGQLAAPAHGAPAPKRRTGVFVDADELRSFVGDLLRGMLGGYQVDAFGNMTFEHEGARVFVTVGPGPLGPQVGVFSITNVDLDLSPELAQFLVTTNHRLAFGSFSYDVENRAVWLRHSLLGGTLDGPELRGAVLSVASTAARADDPIAQRFGGSRFVDAGEAEQARARPPEPDDDDDDVSNASGYL